MIGFKDLFNNDINEILRMVEIVSKIPPYVTFTDDDFNEWFCSNSRHHNKVSLQTLLGHGFVVLAYEEKWNAYNVISWGITLDRMTDEQYESLPQEVKNDIKIQPRTRNHYQLHYCRSRDFLSAAEKIKNALTHYSEVDYSYSK